MINKLRKLIREEISRMFEDVYDDEFNIEDIPDMEPGGDAHKAFMDDLNKEKGIYKEPSGEEVENIIKGLQQANLDLPNDQELIRMAEKQLQRNLNPSEIDKIKSTMERIGGGAGAFNENKI